MPSTDTSAAALPKKPRRRWYQFSLRTLLLFITLIGVLLGTQIIQVINLDKRQRAAVLEIERLGGSVRFQPHSPDSSWWTRMLRQQLLPDNPPDVVEVVLTDKPSEFDLSWLPALTQLQTLTLRSVRITDADWHGLQGLTQMRMLCLSDTNFNDAGSACLTGMTNLEDLYLTRTQITDAALLNLRGLPKLKRIYLREKGGQLPAAVTPAGVAELQRVLPSTTTIYEQHRF